MRMRKKFILILSGIVLIALVLRLGVSYELKTANFGRNAVNSPMPATDMCTYKRLAELISQGDFQDPFYINNAHKYQPFYSSIFLPLVFLIFGYSAWGVIIAQSLLGASTVYLTGMATARIWNRQAAIIAATMAAFSQMLILYTPYMLIATLQAFWLILLFYSVIAAYKSGKKVQWTTCALITGCAVLTRGNVWFIVPGITALAAYSLAYRNSAKERWSKLLRAGIIAAIFIILVILPQVPFSYRNSVLLGRFCGPSSDAPNVLSLGNTPESPPGGREEGWGPGPMEYPQSYAVWTSKNSEVSVPERILDWFYREPLAFIELSFRKFLLFWDYKEIPNNVSLTFSLKQSNFLSYGFIWTAFIIIPAIAGFFILLWRSFKKRDLKMLILMYFILAYCAATVVFYMLARFRTPLIPLLAVLGGIFINRVWRVCKNGHRHHYLSYILAFCASTLICFLGYQNYRMNLESSIISVVRPDGVQIDMGHDRMMYLDNGPYTFGGWSQAPFKYGDQLNKIFKIQNYSEDKNFELEFPLIFAEAGEATLEINDEILKVVSPRPGRVDEKFKISLPHKATVSIKLISATCDLFYVVDTQRDYGRSSINGCNIRGEIVCRLFVNPRK